MDRDEFGVDRRLWFQILMEQNIGKGNWINCISSLQWKSSYKKKEKKRKKKELNDFNRFFRGEENIIMEKYMKYIWNWLLYRVK